MIALDRIMTPVDLRDRPVAAYAMAAVLALAALGIRMLMAEPEDGSPYVTFFPAVFLACAIGGAGPAILCGALSALFVGYFLLPPHGALAILPGHVWSYASFLVACVIGCVPIELLLRTVAAHRKALAELRASETRFDRALRASFGIVYEWDLERGTVFRSPGTLELVGLPPEAIPPTAEGWGALVHPDDRERTREEWGRFLPTGRKRIETQYRVRHADGRWVHVWDRGFVERRPDGTPVRVFGATQDVTARVLAEQGLRAALAHRDALVMEVHHRVKNSLQTVSSLLSVQANRIGDPVARRTFSDAIGRIQAVATVHQSMYRDGDLTRVRLRDHVEELCRQIAAVNGAGPGSHILCEAEVDDACVAPDDLVPLALIVNELLTNALKHGYPDKARGRVAVRFRSLPEPEGGALRIEVADDGVGLPPGLAGLADGGPESGFGDGGFGDGGLAGGLGMTLVRLLVGQLGGTLELAPNEPEPGTVKGLRVRITLPLRPPPPETLEAAAAE